MSHKKEQWVNDVLSSVERIQRATAPAGLYNKTLARIKADVQISKASILRVAAGIALLVGLNVFACATFTKNENMQREQLQAFAHEYSLTAHDNNF